VNSIDNQLVTSKNTKLTGKKPAKAEINNKPNMTMKPQYPYSPHPDNQINQMNQWFRQTPTGKCRQPANRNALDNQLLTHENP
jgi:hypothetical protein